MDEHDMPDKVLLTDLSVEQLTSWVADQGEPTYRATQLFEWIHRSLVFDFSAMTNLPLGFRHTLADVASAQSLAPLEALTSANGLTTKTLFRLRDGETIEAVLMRYESRRTVCISSQVGCAIGCPFCATGQSGFKRNLCTSEIVDQVLYYAQQLKVREESITNVVFMGMGEPLANYDATWHAVQILNDQRGLGLGARRFTISTVGLAPGIRRLAQESLTVGLAVSLHAANDKLRDRLVPVNRRYPLSELIAACQEYTRRTGRRVSFEYALIQGVNDAPEQATELAHLLRGLLCHVNLIPLNPTEGCDDQPPDRQRMMSFRRALTRMGIGNTLRLARGVDIQAGCGQLRSRYYG
ncbi:MAG: 23S rRNA (adenine(2503)-C(2))-methyltransferase RlmN [Anaerolineales bacterium]|nr:MAG: 23S rRNA (adenine(2503)-C(2))-methyltransferase RlmN [Anaerolineales bacterium]